MPQEQTGVLSLLTERRTTTHGGRTFHHGLIAGQPVVLALSKVGKVAAATTAASLIMEHRCSGIVFTGVAGGLGADVRVGDVVIATHLMQHDMDASPLFPKYEVPLYGKSQFETDAALTHRLREASSTLGRTVHEGLIVSGDRFVATRHECAALRRAVPQALAVEMEGAAVAQVCFDFGVPCAVVRTISDGADDDAHVDFTTFVQEVASRVSVQLFQALFTIAP
jgi:adenosylhomocysteine nucleosidase